MLEWRVWKKIYAMWMMGASLAASNFNFPRSWIVQVILLSGIRLDVEVGSNHTFPRIELLFLCFSFHVLAGVVLPWISTQDLTFSCEMPGEIVSRSIFLPLEIQTQIRLSIMWMGSPKLVRFFPCQFASLPLPFYFTSAGYWIHELLSVYDGGRSFLWCGPPLVRASVRDFFPPHSHVLLIFAIFGWILWPFSWQLWFLLRIRHVRRSF